MRRSATFPQFCEWIAERSAEGAARWYLALHSKLGVLRINAERFSLAPESQYFEQEIRNATFRTRSGRRYRILFTIDASDVNVLFVRAPGQDLIQPV